MQSANALRSGSAKVAGNKALHGAQLRSDADDVFLLSDRPGDGRADDDLHPGQHVFELLYVVSEVANADLDA